MSPGNQGLHGCGGRGLPAVRHGVADEAVVAGIEECNAEGLRDGRLKGVALFRIIPYKIG